MTAGSTTMYHAMATLGLAAESGYQGPVKLEGDPKGASVLILGAGLAGMAAALELRQGGYKVHVLEYNNRAGGRNWTIRGGDTVTELSGAIQRCEFDEGLYINPGPWRIPYHHHGLLAYCKRLGVILEPFQQLNHNAFLHSTNAFGGKPQRVRHIMADFRGHTSELLGKMTQKGALDGDVTKEDQEMLLQALRSWGALDENYAYKDSIHTNEFRGFETVQGGGLSAVPTPGKPLGLSEILSSGLWSSLVNFALYEFQTTMFQPSGGIDMIGKAFVREVGDLVTYNAKVTKIDQNDSGVTVYYENTENPGTMQRASGEWCVCTIPLTILSQIDLNVGAQMLAAIGAVPYASSVKVGLQFKRRFWEEDDQIFGGVSYTNLPIRQISYPSTDFNTKGKGVLLGCYTWNGPNSYEFTSMAPEERVRRVVEYGAQIHSQYKEEFENGVSWAWHRSPFTLGCAADWTEEARREHYDNLCKIDGRIVLAGEHTSCLPGWMEGAILSSLDAISRLHKRVMEG
ncbi:flavin monoamine oxidase family protein [Rhizobium gallicum]|uniref:flavin monoamine oxidase family protein n=1 Tax=Rhizobium gallicum TaxID=56730 RepID=UPI001EF934AF|nr:flavin monoamine oxidase family protein [Rhizobium gallicum]ULJ74576.1 flavin monoamine oxidase family protein [Rhizobium gallicum]